MIFITGDIHGNHDIYKLSSQCFTIQNKLTRSDYVIICGDFGLLWCNSEQDKYWLKWLDEKPWTTLWIDGNHENFDMLKEYPIEDWHGGKVQKITDNIIHLCRGSIFEIEGKRIFAFGGAESHDKKYRKLGYSVWKEELPSKEEIEFGRKNLEKANWSVDIIISHSLPEHIQEDLFHDEIYRTNDLTLFFDTVDKRADFDFWFSGHYHMSGWYDKKHILIYNDIVKLTDKGIERIYSSENKN
mgnify:FL=1